MNDDNTKKSKRAGLIELNNVEKKWLIPIKDIVYQPDREKSYTKKNLDFTRLRALVTQHADKIEDNEGIMELLPDLIIVRETLVANILSPVDLQEVKLNIGVHQEAPAEIAEIIREHFSTVYDLSSQLGNIVADALFVRGSHVLMLIPPTAIRKVIYDNTVGLESLLLSEGNAFQLPNIGIIGNKDSSYSLESLEIKLDSLDKENHKELEEVYQDVNDKLNSKDKSIEISDNILYLLYPILKESASKQKVQRVLHESWGIESLDEIPTIDSTYYKNRQVQNIPFLDIDVTADTECEFDPIVLNLPAEAVIPVHKPNNPKEHLGYYVFLDEEGNPLKYKSTVNKFREMNNKLDKLMDQQTVSNTITMGVSYPNNNGKARINASENRTLLAAYAMRFEKQLREAIQNGATGQKVEISDTDELYRIMFARQLEKQKTRIIYVPANMMSYIAFNYDVNGRGESLLDKTKLYASFRAILMFATVIAGVKSSINLSTLSIKLDDDDPDPQGTVENIINEFVAMQATGLPLGRLNPLDIVDSLQKAGMQIKIDGNRFPGTSMELAETKREIAPPDTSIMDMLKDIHYAGLWVNRETIEKSNDIEFMGQLVNSNNLQNKRFLRAQTDYGVMLADLMKKYICLGGPLYNRLESEYNKLKGKSSLTFKEVIDSIHVLFPKSDNVIIKSQMEEYKDFSEFIELAVNDYIDEGMLKDLLKGDNINAGIEDIKSSVLATLKRQFLRSKNMLPELDAMINDADNTVGDILNNHNDLVMKLVTNVLKHVTKAEHKEDEDINKLKESLDPPPTDTDESASGLDDTTGMDDSDNLNLDDTGTGDDNADANLDLPSDDTTSDLDNNLDENIDETSDKVDNLDEGSDDENKSKDDEDKDKTSDDETNIENGTDNNDDKLPEKDQGDSEEDELELEGDKLKFDDEDKPVKKKTGKNFVKK